MGACLLLAASATAVRWRPPVPERVLRTMRPREGPRLLQPPAGELVAGRVEWQWDGPPRRWSVVILDVELAEIGRVGPTDAGASSAPLAGALAQRLLPGATYYWYVESTDAAPPLRSRVSPFLTPAR